jgi:chaperonin GroES
MKFAPVGDNLLLSVLMEDQQTESGLYIPAELESNVLTNTVVAVGPGRPTLTGERVPCLSEIGDQVVFNRQHAISVTLGGKKYYVVSESNTLGIIPKAK